MESFQNQLYFPNISDSNTLSATYAVWNIINYISRKYDSKYRYQHGHIRPIQAKVLMEILSDNPRTYCEFGFNTGHSAVLALQTNSKINVHSFDIMSFAYGYFSVVFPQF